MRNIGHCVFGRAFIVQRINLDNQKNADFRSSNNISWLWWKKHESKCESPETRKS